MKEPLAYDINELVGMGPFGKSSLYKAINSGQLHAKKFGKKTVVTEEDYRRFLESLPDYPAKSQQAA